MVRNIAYPPILIRIGAARFLGRAFRIIRSPGGEELHLPCSMWEAKYALGEAEPNHPLPVPNSYYDSYIFVAWLICTDDVYVSDYTGMLARQGYFDSPPEED